MEVSSTCLTTGFLPGSSLKISGTVNSNPTRFQFDLNSQSQDTVFHFNPRFVQNCIVRNSCLNGSWGPEELDGSLPFGPGQTFTVIIHCEEKGFKVVVDDSYTVFYDHRVHPRVIGQLVIYDDVCISDVDYKPAGAQSCVELNTSLKDLNEGFLPGSVLKISGTVSSNPKRIDVNLQNDCQDIAFHFNPRFTENRIVRNSRIKGSWGSQEVEGGFPFAAGQPFSVFIYCEDKGFRIVVNNSHNYFFEHRHHPRIINQVHIYEDVSISEVDYKPSPARGGGHCRRKCC